MKKAIPRIIGGHWGKDKFPSPDKNYQKKDNPATKVNGIDFGLDKKDKLFEKGVLFLSSLFSF
jgi:hypothetical protein